MFTQKYYVIDFWMGFIITFGETIILKDMITLKSCSISIRLQFCSMM